jgi:hypothetical protein
VFNVNSINFTLNQGFQNVMKCAGAKIEKYVLYLGVAVTLLLQYKLI